MEDTGNLKGVGDADEDEQAFIKTKAVEATQMELHQPKGMECNRPTGPNTSNGTREQILEEGTTLKVADGKLNRMLQKVTIPDQSS